jgi:hypothetical protein
MKSSSDGDDCGCKKSNKGTVACSGLEESAFGRSMAVCSVLVLLAGLRLQSS